MIYHPATLYDPLDANRRLKWALVIAGAMTFINIVAVVLVGR